MCININIIKKIGIKITIDMLEDNQEERDGQHPYQPPNCSFSTPHLPHWLIHPRSAIKGTRRKKGKKRKQKTKPVSEFLFNSITSSSLDAAQKLCSCCKAVVGPPFSSAAI